MYTMPQRKSFSLPCTWHPVMHLHMKSCSIMYTMPQRKASSLPCTWDPAQVHPLGSEYQTLVNRQMRRQNNACVCRYACMHVCNAFFSEWVCVCQRESDCGFVCMCMCVCVCMCVCISGVCTASVHPKAATLLLMQEKSCKEQKLDLQSCSPVKTSKPKHLKVRQ